MARRDRRRRFVQEAQAASALNHPHIITIHEIESADGNDFIVMEYVRGKSLDALIPRQGLRLNELLRIAIPVADALAAAHARGIIHRDLKPANVMVGDDGAVKVLDFGLAKLMDRRVTPDEQTVTHVGRRPERARTIAGTAAYMSPEQATGGKVDARSDIFSFGAMLYEMATGTRRVRRGIRRRHACRGASGAAEAADAAVTGAAARARAADSALPPEGAGAALSDDARREHRAAGDQGGVGLGRSRAHRPLPPAPASRRRGHGVAAAIVLVAAAGWLLRPRAAPDRRRCGTCRSRVSMARALAAAVSRWRTGGVFVGQRRRARGRAGATHFDIYLKLVGASDVRRLTTDPGGNWVGGWSPDGRQIACCRVGPHGGTDLTLISPVTGTERKLVGFRSGGPPLAWSPDGRDHRRRRVSAPAGGGIYFIPVDGGEPRLVWRNPRPQSFVSPALRPTAIDWPT